MNTLRHLRAEEAGAAFAEYALLAGLIAGVAVAAARGLGPVVAAKFESGAAAFNGAGPAPPPIGGGSAPGAG
jgi:Flp pilus assembly pilin Flp